MLGLATQRNAASLELLKTVMVSIKEDSAFGFCLLERDISYKK